jgi:thiosulfate/3-mercaptopyruvate sulfurtransferase
MKSGALTTVVSGDKLATHLGEDDWAIIDCRFELAEPGWGEAAYRAGHVPGAVYAHLDRDLSGTTTGKNGRHPLPDPTRFVEKLGRWGIRRNVQVVVYDQDAGLYAGRLWWLLRAFGHEQVALLNGGYAKWIAERRPIRAGDERRPPRLFDGNPQPGRYVTVDDILRLASDTAYHVIDVRAPERFRGEVEPIDPVAGHIPGATNRFSRLNMNEDGTILPPEVLRRQFTQLLAGVPSQNTVFYCGSGVFSCHSLLALAYAGLEPGRLYNGSWSEWCQDPSRPVATGGETETQ